MDKTLYQLAIESKNDNEADPKVLTCLDLQIKVNLTNREI